MIKVHVTGRLGNQLFQYAAARALALKYNTDVRLDLSAYDRQYYMLDCFDVCGKVVTSVDKVGAFLGRYKNYEEVGDKFDPDFFGLGGKVSIRGYFQSEKYFKFAESEVRAELSIKHLVLRGKDVDIEARINSTNAVAVHVRRADYVRSVWDVCDKDYYYRAVSYIESRVEKPTYFVFSDDTKWCRENLNFENVCFVESDGSKESVVKDLHLMTLCRHLIIPNSTFSWWGAWLCRNQEKIVVSPNKWSVNGEFSIDDRICDFWHVMADR